MSKLWFLFNILGTQVLITDEGLESHSTPRRRSHELRARTLEWRFPNVREGDEKSNRGIDAEPIPTTPFGALASRPQPIEGRINAEARRIPHEGDVYQPALAVASVVESQGARQECAAGSGA
jgi:hypothetical protein